MKAIIPKSWDCLPEKEKQAIVDYCTRQADLIIDRGNDDLQIVWLKLACILLHNAFGFGESRLNLFLGNWKRIYRINAKLGNSAEQARYLAEQMKVLFPKHGFPVDFIDSLRSENCDADWGDGGDKINKKEIKL